MGLWLPGKVIWQQQLRSFSCKHILLSKNDKYFNVFNNATILTGFCSVQKVIPPSLLHYAIARARGTTLKQCAVLSVLLCSTDTVPGQQPAPPCQQYSELLNGKHQKHSCCSDSNPRITFIFYLLHEQLLATASSYLCHRFLALSEHCGVLFWSLFLFQFAVFSLL